MAPGGPRSQARRPGRSCRLAVLAAAAALASSACIEDRLSVDLLTQVQADGSCTRRVEYRLERLDDGKPVAIDPARSPLRTLHRFPTGQSWRVEEDLRDNVHVVRVEGTLPSPDAADGDYLRAPSPDATPGRNYVSSHVDEKAGRYEYVEVFRDPNSPLRGIRFAARFLNQQDDFFAERLASSLGEEAPQRSDVRRLFRRHLSEPILAATATLAERPLFGPRERRELDRVVEGFDARSEALLSAVNALVPGLPPERLEESAQAAFQEIYTRLDQAAGKAGIQSLLGEDGKIRFRATLTMPVPIIRANTCVSGDTASWEFEQQDLFGRGFEMSAVAGER